MSSKLCARTRNSLPARRRSSVSPSPRCSRSSASSVSRAKRSPWLSTADAVSAPTSSEKGRTAYPRASTSLDDSPLHVVELGAILREATPAGAVGENAVVQLVRRAYAALLERGRHPVNPVRERRFLPVHGGCDRCVGRSPTLPPSPWPPSSSPFATPRNVGARSQLRRELRSATCSSAWISSLPAASRSSTTWSGRALRRAGPTWQEMP